MGDKIVNSESSAGGSDIRTHAIARRAGYSTQAHRRGTQFSLAAKYSCIAVKLLATLGQRTPERVRLIAPRDYGLTAQYDALKNWVPLRCACVLYMTPDVYRTKYTGFSRYFFR